MNRPPNSKKQMEGVSMFKQRVCAVFFAGLVFTFLNCQNSFSSDINLDDFFAPLQISSSESNLKLTRGTYTYNLKKEEVLNNKKYIVSMTDNLSYTSAHKSAPEDAYSRILEIVPADDQVAVRAMGFLKQGGDMKIDNPADMANAQQIMADVEHLNQAAFGIGILPSDSSIRSVSKQIKKEDTIKVSGIRFKLSSVINNGKQEPISHCLGSIDVFYLTGLEIENN